MNSMQTSRFSNLRYVTWLGLFSLLFIACVKDKTIENPPTVPPMEEELPQDTLSYILITSLEYQGSTKVTTLTSYNPDGSIKWRRRNLGTNLTPIPVVYANRIYMGTTNSYYDSAQTWVVAYYFYVFKEEDGSNYLKIASSGFERSYPVVRNDTFYCSSTTGYSHYIEARKTGGPLLWSTKVNGMYRATDLQLDGEILYFVSSPDYYGSNVNALDLTTKTVKWKAPIGINIGQMYSTLTISPNLIYVRNGTGAVVALNKTDGAIAWAVNGKFGQPYYANNLVYAIDETMGLVAFDAATGKQKWNWTAGSNVLISGEMLVYGKNILLKGSNHKGSFIASIKSVTGEENWKVGTTKWYTEMGVAQNKLYLMRPKGYGDPIATQTYIDVVDAGNGTVKDSLPILDNLYGPMKLVVH